MRLSRDFDVAVDAAAPLGLLLANLLARHGLTVIVGEQLSHLEICA